MSDFFCPIFELFSVQQMFSHFCDRFFQCSAKHTQVVAVRHLLGHFVPLEDVHPIGLHGVDQRLAEAHVVEPEINLREEGEYSSPGNGENGGAKHSTLTWKVNN